MTDITDSPKLCVLYNFAPRYREAIFKAIDDRWDADWYFGSNSTDIKGLDLSVLKRSVVLTNKSLKGHWYWQKGATSLLKKTYSTYFLLGDPYCVSSWIMALRIKFFSKHKKLYFWTHGWYGKEGRMTKIIKKMFFKLATGVFLYGNYAKELMIQEGFPESKLFVIHNSLDYYNQKRIRERISGNGIYRAHFENDNPTLIFIGRLTKVKRLDLLIEAVASLNKSEVACNVVFVGDGTERANLKQLARQMGIEKHCWFYGACYDEKQNAELIYNADLCVAPGNVGLTAMHAMVFGTPVISHDDFKWQMPEFEAIKPGRTGDFFKKDSLPSLTDTIQTWLWTHKDRAIVRKACYDEIDNYWTPDYQMSVFEQHLKV